VTDQPLIKKTPSSELDHRIGALQSKMVSGDIDGILVIQNSDLFYFSGTTQQAHLYVPASGQELALEAGMVVALEPKVVLPGKGVVGIENTHVVAAGGLRQLTVFEESITVV